MPITEILEDVLRKKARPGFKLEDDVKHEKGDPMTPADLVRQVFHEDPKALLRSFGSHGRARRAKFAADKEKGSWLQRTFARNTKGKVVMAEKQVGSKAKKAVKKTAPKKKTTKKTTK